MKICSIEDVELVDSILTDKDVYGHISDDYSVSAKEFSVLNILESNIPVIMPNDHTVIIYMPHNGATYSAHINATKKGRGSMAIAAAEIGFDYAFKELNCEKLIAYIPEIYPNVSKFILGIGFELEGTLTGSYKKNGVLYNENIYGIRRMAWEQREL